MCATPHCNVPGCFDNYRTEALEERFLCLARLLGSGHPSAAVCGMEVYVTPETPRHLREGKLTLAAAGISWWSLDLKRPSPLLQRMLEEISAAGGSLWWPTRNATVLRRRTGGAFSGG